MTITNSPNDAKVLSIFGHGQKHNGSIMQQRAETGEG